MSKNCKGKKIAIVVAHEFEDVELLYPIIRLSEEGAEIYVVRLHCLGHDTGVEDIR